MLRSLLAVHRSDFGHMLANIPFLEDIRSGRWIFLLIPLVADCFNQYMLKNESTNGLRVITGLLSGIGIGLMG